MNKHAMRLLEAVRDMVQSKEFGAQVLGINEQDYLDFSGTLDGADGIVAKVHIRCELVTREDAKHH